MHKTVLLLALMLGFLPLDDASAQNVPIENVQETPLEKKVDDSTWLILGGVSRNTCRNCGFREDNPGLAVQWRSDWLNNKFSYTGNDEWRMSAGAYINSNNRNSLYVAALWQPLEYKSEDVTLKTGVQVAIISNYLKQAITPTFVPAISVETKHVGADIFLVPKFPSVSAAVLLSFKVRF